MVLEFLMYKAIIACMIGSIFEWYDFALYGYFAAILGKLFFPSSDPLVSVIAAFGVFAAGFAIRPIGALVFGHIGDKYGRKKALVISMLLMTFPTVALGCLPTYEQIGILAPILLIIIRLVQGLSIGGNASGIFTFMIEYAPSHRRGFVGSLSVMSAIKGILIGSGVVAYMSSTLTTQELESWGWRLPFFAGAVVGLLAFYLRKKIPETPRFIEECKASDEDKSYSPVKELFKKSKGKLIRSIFMLVLNDIGFYVCFIYLTTYMTMIVKIPMETAMIINTINMLVIIKFAPIMGWLSDHIGRKPIMMGACILFFVSAIPVFSLIDKGGFWQVLAGQAVFAVGVAMYFGTMATMLVEKFPTRSRYTGLAVSLNVTAALFGGTAPLVVTYFIDVTGWNHIPAYYLMVGALVSFVALLFIKDRYREPLL